jgi:hypothetical protein
MKDLIKKILREDFDWAVDVPSYDDMKIDWEEHVIPYLTGKRPTYDEDGDIKDYDEWDEISPNEQEEYAPLAKHYFVRELNDIDFEDGKFIMRVGSWDEFTGMFKDCDYSGYICKHTAEQVLGEDDFWEPYYDVVYDWKDQVWESVDGETYKLIIEHIKKHCVGDRIHMEDYGEVELTDSLIDSWTSETFILGDIIDGNDGGCFEDLKNTMRWAYEGAYNDAARDEYWNSTHEAIKGVVGESEWESYEGKDRQGNPMTRHQLKFDVTDIFMDSIREYFDGYCDLDYDHECELEYGSYLDNLIFIMNEEIYGEPLNPRVSEWPDSNKVEEYFNERMRDEL